MKRGPNSFVTVRRAQTTFAHLRDGNDTALGTHLIAAHQSVPLKPGNHDFDGTTVMLCALHEVREHVTGSLLDSPTVAEDTELPTPQESFWAGDFGQQYTSRNQAPSMEDANVWLFSRALRGAGPITSVMEFGANSGLNLRALRRIYSCLDCHAVEINPAAAELLAAEIGAENTHLRSLFDYDPEGKSWDLVLCKGVLIHLAPENLERAYEKIHLCARRYVLMMEYYSPDPVMVPYRGHQNRLFKRDYAGEFLDRYPDYSLLDYGFAYRRDPVAPQDDLTWFLMKRSHVG